MIVLLIYSYKKYKKCFSDPKILVTKSWNKVGQEMRKNYDITDEQCRKKWLTLVNNYEKTKKHMGKSGNCRMNFEFYDDMDEALQKDVTIDPISTATSEKFDSGEESDLDLQGKIRRKKVKLSNSELMAMLITEKEASRKDKRKQAEKKIEVAKKLVNVVENIFKKIND